MDKILVEVYVPASNDKHDVFIPVSSKLYEVVYLLSSTVSELSHGYFKATPDTVLCNKSNGEILNINQTIEELNLQNGAKLMLF
ncbi:hypothetical protein JOC95_000290 [Bacillus tianshenii]|uniref:Methyltransferase n=1 Tax=Sutcliffiella tianshenii TaxID=1463404 RepID=A0ABS2NVJ3_9BACI|nr:methyltransferase [Bacillus tianshenii]MBM7618448.1 hypothetical protein [Bacillus tianshenii]